MSAPSLATPVFAPFRQLFDLGGRTGRRDHWPYMLLLIGLWLGGFLVPYALTRTEAPFWAYVLTYAGGPPPFGMPIFDGLYLLLILLAFAAVVRRLHDIGHSGGWMVAYLLLEVSYIALIYLGPLLILWSVDPSTRLPQTPIIFLLLFMALPFFMHIWLVVLTVFCLQRGTVGPNLYGPDPRNEVAP